MTYLRTAARSSFVVFLIPANIVVGTAWHEIVGHGLVGLACGGHVNQIIVVGVQLWPHLTWTGTSGAFGWCDVEGVTGGVCTHLWLFTGSLSTLLVSSLAITLLYARKWSGPIPILLLGCAFWWIDLFTYTLPCFGLRRYIIFGRRISEPYDAAVALGIPGWLFQLFVLVTCSMLAVLSIKLLIRTLVRR